MLLKILKFVRAQTLVSLQTQIKDLPLDSRDKIRHNRLIHARTP